MNRKVVCEEYRCQWRGLESQVLKAKNPFDPDYEINGCPSCKEINTIVYACDEPRYWKPVTCGTPTNNGYRSTCGQHKPEKNCYLK